MFAYWVLLDRLDEPFFIAEPITLLTEFDIPIDRCVEPNFPFVVNRALWNFMCEALMI